MGRKGRKSNDHDVAPTRSPKALSTHNSGNSDSILQSPKESRRRLQSSHDERTSGKQLFLGTDQDTLQQSNSTEDNSKCQHTYRMHRINFFEYEPQAINCICCDEVNNRLALSRSDGTLEIWVIEQGRADLYQSTIICTDPGTSIEALLWSRGVLYSGGLEGDLIMYNMNLLKPKMCIPCHAGAIWCMTLNSSQTHIAAGTEEGCVVLFEFDGECFQYERSLQKQEERMLSIAWHVEGEVIVTGGIDNIRLWSVSTGHAVQRITIGRQHPDKQTIVWSVLVLKDMTIVSGDSRGKVTFWNGKQGTQIKMFGCHRADILCLCANPAENQVFAAGIDPTLVQFELIPVTANSDWMVWQRSGVRAHHTHDVRAMAIAHGYVITGGVDCCLVAASFEEKVKYTNIPLPHRELVHVAGGANLVLLQYATNLQLWTLGTTSTLPSQKDETQETFPQSSEPINLLQLRSRGEERIVCSAISSHGKWIGYADRSSLRLFHVDLEGMDLGHHHISATRLRGLPAAVVADAVRCMVYNASGTQLFLGCVDGSIKSLSLREEPPQASLAFSAPPQNGSGIVQILVLSADGQRLAFSDSNYNVFVFDVSFSTITLLCRLPRKEIYVTALSFSPDGHLLALAYSSHQVLEYDLTKRCYSAWCSQLTSSEKNSKQILSTVTKITAIRYCRRDSSLLLLQDALGVKVLDKARVRITSKRNMYDQRYLMHFEELDDDFAVVVERSPAVLSSCLPQALSHKQFGT